MSGEQIGLRAAILDLDATTILSRLDARPSRAVVEAAHRAAGRGKKIIPATGRPWVHAKQTIEDLGVKSYCLVNGGAEIVSPGLGGIPVEYVTLTAADHPEALEAVFEECDARRIPVYSSQSQYGLGESVLTPGELPDNNTKLFLQGIRPDQAKKLVKVIRTIPDLTAYRSSSFLGEDVNDIHITDVTATKKNVDYILQRHGIARSETMVAGDSEIDLPMMTLEGIGLVVAVENASSKVKEIADVIAPSVENDGVAWALRKHLLGETIGSSGSFGQAVDMSHIG